MHPFRMWVSIQGGPSSQTTDNFLIVQQWKEGNFGQTQPLLLTALQLPANYLPSLSIFAKWHTNYNCYKRWLAGWR